MNEKEYNKIMNKPADTFSICDVQLIKGYLMSLLQQLQAYKDKEDKLREYIPLIKNILEDEYAVDTITKELSQIINKGSDK